MIVNADGSERRPTTDMEGDNPPEAWAAHQAHQGHEALQKSNQETMRNLQRDGFAIDVLTMLKMRLDFVTDALVGTDEESQLRFGIGWEEFLHDVLSGAEAEARKAALTAGQRQMPGQLILPDHG